LIQLVDQDLVFLKIQEIEKYTHELNKYRGIKAEEMENDLAKLWAVQHGLQLSIQVILDTGNHILAEKGIPIQEYAEIFPELARLGVIPKDYAENIKGMAGLRNLLVHEYTGIDLERIAAFINNNLSDFNHFASYVLSYLEREKNNGNL